MKPTEKIAITGLLHDIPHILHQLDIAQDIDRLTPAVWADVKSLLTYTSKHHLQKDLDGKQLNDEHILAELIGEAENISLAKIIDSPGSVSPLKSIMYGLQVSHEETADRFFHASELSDSVMLDLKRSKKEVYFAPSYLITAFFDDLEQVAAREGAAHIDTLYFMLRKYFWSFTLQHHGDDFMFSCFDHAKMTAALACCLYLYLQEHHKNIFISQNISIIRETIRDFTEPRFFFLKLSINYLQNNIKPSHLLKQRVVLLKATRAILELYGLYECNVMYTSSCCSVILLPNLNRNRLHDLIRQINDRIFTQFGFEHTISVSEEISRKSDFFSHVSSHRTVAQLLFGRLQFDRPQPVSDSEFLCRHFDELFAAIKHEDGSGALDSLWDSLRSMQRPALAVATNSKEDDDEPVISCIDLATISADKKSEHRPGIDYHISPAGNFLHDIKYTPATRERGFILDTFNRETDTAQYPLLKAHLAVKDPSRWLQMYPDVAHIQTFLHTCEIIMQGGIGMYLRKRPEVLLYHGEWCNLLFHAPLASLDTTIRRIYELINEYTGKCPAVRIQLEVLFDDQPGAGVTRQPLELNDHGIYLFDRYISFPQIFELFEKGSVLVELSASVSEQHRQRLARFMRNIVTYDVVPVEAGAFAIGNQDISELFLSYFDPVLLAKWTTTLLTKES